MVCNLVAFPDSEKSLKKKKILKCLSKDSKPHINQIGFEETL